MSSPSSPVPSESTPLLRHANFLRLWTAQTISVFGDQFTFLAVPIIAVLMLEASPGQMGVLTAVGRAPFLLIGLFAGVWVDRLPRRPILIVGDIGRALLLATIPLAAFAGVLRMPQLYAVAFFAGILTVFFDVAYQAYLPSLVNRSQLVEGNSKLEASRSVAQLAGPGIAGILIQALSAPLTIVVDALSFLFSALFLGQIKQKEEPPKAIRAPLLAEVREGLAVVFGNRLLRSIAGCTGTFNLFSSMLDALFILFATRELGLTPVAIGAIFSVGSVAGLLGALVAGRLARWFGIGPMIVSASFLTGLSQLPIVFATPAQAFILLSSAFFAGRFGNPIYNINQVSLRQAIVSQRLQGRMNATMRFLVWGTLPIGGLVGGILGELLGLRMAIGISVVGSFAAFLWVLFSPVRTLRRIPEPEAT